MKIKILRHSSVSMTDRMPFFYCDPPYFETEGHHEVVFRKEDHALFYYFQELKGIEETFIYAFRKNACRRKKRKPYVVN